MLYVKKERAKEFCNFLAKTKLNQTIIWETEFEDEDYLFGHFGIDAESDKKDGNTPSIRITTVNVYGY